MAMFERIPVILKHKVNIKKTTRNILKKVNKALGTVLGTINNPNFTKQTSANYIAAYLTMERNGQENKPQTKKARKKIEEEKVYKGSEEPKGQNWIINTNCRWKHKLSKDGQKR